jgi:DegV family protein with EDD domain
MSLTLLNNAQFHAAILAGCKRLIHHRQLLNDINVFPVADGDTGDNLSSTCQAIIDFSSVKPHLNGTLISIADASIIGARGNSGIIFSQFFNLLALHTHDVKELKFHCFSKILTKISDEIPAVLSKPLQGTMLTIIQKLASFSEYEENNNTFAQAMLKLLPPLFLEVEKTKQLLSTLKKANVVDAGALGFYYFIEGLTEFLQAKTIRSAVWIDSSIPALDDHALLANPPEFRYCTEAVLKTTSLDKRALMNFLKNQGDSASLAGNERINRIHVHTLYKEHIVQYPKIDDMLRQYQLQFERNHKIALVTDSSADLPQSLIDEYQIHQICLNIQIDQHQLLDKHSFEPNYFYQQLNQFKIYPKTSCLNTKLVETKLANIAKHYDQVIILSISSKMSGMYEAFREAGKKFNNITVVDTKTNSGAHGLLLHYAGKLINSGESFDNIITLLNGAIKNTYIFVMVDQFESMIRSGRINKISGKIAAWANIKPIVSIDHEGNGIIVSKCFSKSAACNKLIALVNQKLHDREHHLEEYCIVHADEIDQAVDLSMQAKKVFNKPALFIESVSLAVGLHAGKGCIAIAARISEKST